MRIAVSAEDSQTADSAVSPHFGRCPCYVLADLASTQVKAAEVVAGPYYGARKPGHAPGFIRDQNGDHDHDHHLSSE